MATATDFLTGLGTTLTQQFGIGDAKSRAQDILQNGIVGSNGNIGAFADGIIPNAERSYTEEGSFRTDYYNPKPKQLEILMQEPDITVLVKKRAFASLAENFRPDLMDAQEALFYKATKVLFQNKCKQISAYEKLCKISQVSAELGRVDSALLPIIFAATDTLTQAPAAAGLNSLQDSINGALSGFASVVNRVREIVAFNQTNEYTTWLTNIPSTFDTNFAQGTGVIEFTNVSSLTTTSTLKFAEGSFTLQFNDPYQMMLITDIDIEQAINDSVNKLYNNSFQQLATSSLDQTITSQTNILNANRAARNANPITFNIQPDATTGNSIIAIIENIGFQINFTANIISNLTNSSNIDNSALQGSASTGNDGLSPNDVSLFNNIVSMIYNQLTLAATSRRQAIADNQNPTKNLNAVRKRLRLHYKNKLIIQPMDNVHIYIGSKKRIDTKIMGALQSSFGAQGILQGVNNLVQDIKDTFAISENYLLEKSVYVGSEFPNWLWQILRSQFVADKNGAHTFAGVVEESSRSFSNNGTFSVSASGKDNAAYFNYGVVNFKPSVDVFNGGLYDPLSPFKLEFDSATGALKYQKDGAPELLDENKYLFGSAFVKNKSGLYAGIQPTEKGYLSQDADRVKNNAVRRVFYDPDGMVYRWKEGIGTLVLFGDSYEPNPTNNLPPAITDDPFAGQDIINVLSLLITGEPYNFATFYKAATQFDSFKRDPGSNQDPSVSYFRGLKTQLKSRNAIYGNFIPFKKLTMDDATFSKMVNKQLTTQKFDTELNDLLQQRATLADQLAIFGKSNQQTVSTGIISDTAISNKIASIDQLIQTKSNSITTELQSAGSTLNIIGNDVSFDASSLNSGGSQTRLDQQNRKNLRRKISFLTQRVLWKVRANEDTNLLIVDDTYDKDYDIQAFEKTFTNPALFKSEYITVADKINNVVNLIRGMEVFCDTQGHIQIRNPKYNMMPSSIFNKMFNMKNQLGIQIFPQFLEDLAINQITSLFNEIGVLEDEIRLYCLALGKATDADCSSFISKSSSTSNPGKFVFLSSESTGNVSNSISSLNLASQPDNMYNYIQKALTSVQSQTNLNVFSVLSRAAIVQSVVLPPSNNAQSDFAQSVSQSLNSSTTQTRATTITNRLLSKTGQTFSLNQLFSNTTNGTIALSTISSVDILRITNGVAERLSQRQSAIKLAANALKNVQETITLSNGTGGPGNQTNGNANIQPNSTNTRSIPKVFESMIEDESFDDIGLNSGKRYIIKNQDILSYNISERRPPFTSIEVSGRLGDLYIQNNQLPQDLNVFQNGNALITAAAVDYDMWRMYGMSLPTSIDAPYLSNPDTQCAPYAVSLLNKARKEILSGSLDVVGNEYQQPGEVIYLEPEDLLFYVESVRHSFTYGRSFTTSMNITYGHNAGEYIPTFLDVIGKVLYNNKDISNFVHKRQGNIFNQEHIGTICGSVNSGGTSTLDAKSDIISGQFGNANKVALQNIISYAGSTLALASGSINPTLEIRVYFNSSLTNFSSASSYAMQLQQAVNDYLIGKTSLDGNSNPAGNPSTSSSSLSSFKSQINIVMVDGSTNNVNEFRYPSNNAFYYARKALNDTSSNSSSNPASQGQALQAKIDKTIYGYIVDCWILFSNPTHPNPTPTLTKIQGN